MGTFLMSFTGDIIKEFQHQHFATEVARLRFVIGSKVDIGSAEATEFLQNSPNLGDGKCLEKPRKSFVELPIAKFFRASSRE